MKDLWIQVGLVLLVVVMVLLAVKFGAVSAI